MSQERSYPLAWPSAWKRTVHRERAKFSSRRENIGGSGHNQRLSISVALDRIAGELDRLHAGNVVLSSDLLLRNDGWPRAGQSEPRDPGIALYFTFREQKTVLACDKWDRVADNIAALAGHVYALRAIERYGVGTLEQAFRGYQQLEDFSAGVPWRRVLGFKDDELVTLEQVESKYRTLAKEYHPDLAGGDHAQMAQLTAAIAAARKELTK